MENNKIICIFEKGFSKISLPDRYIINVDSCDDGCYITTKNMIDDLNELNKFIDYPIYNVFLDDNSIEKGYKLGECKIVSHIKYDIPYDAIYFNDISITGDNIVKEVN